MPWRIRPRAAWAIGLPCALLLSVAWGVVRAPRPPPVPSPQIALAPALTSIDGTLSRDDEGCAGVRSTEWHPLSGVEYTGRLRITLPPLSGATMVMFIGDSVPLDIHAENEAGSPARMRRERLHTGPGVGVPPDFWLDDNAPWAAPPEITRLVIEAPRERVHTYTLSLGRRAPRVVARLFGYPAETRARVCAAPLPEGERYFATGWYAEERQGDAVVRWMSDRGAIFVSSTHGGSARVRIRAAPAVPSNAAEATYLVLRVNDVVDLPRVRLREGMADYEWNVPDAAWVSGTNELFFTVSRTTARGTRRIGLALSSLHVE